MPTKTCAVKVKATAADDTTLQEGQFVALASVFNNIDAVGDVVMPGAFADDLKSWEASGEPIPVLWGHQMNDPNMNIGEVLSAEETDAGLEVTAQLDLDNPTAKQVYRLLKGRRVGRMSFAYDVEDGAPAERDGKSVYELRKLKLHEVSVVQIPANPAAIVQQVKVHNTADSSEQLVENETGVKTGRTLSAKNEATLRSALDRMTEAVNDVKTLLTTLDKNSDDGKASPPEPATAEEPDGVKADQPANRPGTASLRLRTDLDLLQTEVFLLTD